MYKLVFLIILVSCTNKSIRDPGLAYDTKRYSLASQLYIQEYESSKSRSDKAVIAYRIGDCYDKMGKYTLSKQWLKKSYDLEASNKTLLSYAFALKKNEEYQDAMDAFAELSNEVQGVPEFRKEANLCRLARELKKNQNKIYNYKIEKHPFSSEGNDYSATYNHKGKITFSSDKIGSEGNNKYDWSGNFYSDIYEIPPTGEPVRLNNKINTQDNEGTACWNNSGTMLLFTRCSDLSVGNHFCQIYQYKFNSDNAQDELLNLGGGNSNTQHPALHTSDSILVFSSDREGGQGQYDLYLSYFREGVWTTAINLGEIINTEGNEKFPVWYNDTLYFSSDEHSGLGGLDIFKTWRWASGEWAIPQRLDYPINSGADDFSYSADPLFVRNDTLLEKAIFSSNRNQESGDDIYTLVKTKNKSEAAVRNYTASYQYKLNYFKTQAYSIQTINETLDSVSVQIQADKIYSTGTSNSLTIIPKENQKLKIRSGRRGFLNHEIEISIDSIGPLVRDTLVKKEINIALIPIEYDREYLLKNVYYDLNKSEIRDDAKPALDELFQLLQTNPVIKVLISSHTDCRADDNYNLNLSDARARAARDYLVQKGIPIERIQYKGYGEMDPVVKCGCESCTEEEHQLNRRSGFKLIR